MPEERKLIEFTDLVNELAHHHNLHPDYVSDRLGAIGATMDERLYRSRTGRFSLDGAAYARTIMEADVTCGIAHRENNAYLAPAEKHTTTYHVRRNEDEPTLSFLQPQVIYYTLDRDYTEDDLPANRPRGRG